MMEGTGRAVATVEMQGLDAMRAWALGLKPYFERLEAEGGAPALWAAAQACHESYSVQTGGPTVLAQVHLNLWGIKAASWQQEYGCKAVRLDTFEYIDGSRVDLEDAFCSMPSLEVAFQVYKRLFEFPRYAHAAQWRHDPLLYGLEIWRSGYATNPAYITGEWGVPFWIKALDADFAKPARRPVAVVNGKKRGLAEGWLEGNQTVAPVRQLLESLGYRVEWEPMRVIVKRRR